jgi:hypothetical protein
MNLLEKKMVDVLKDLKENHHVIGVKAEFEAEGTRLEDAIRLKEIVMMSGLNLTIKIGGCEALRDMYECRVLGVERIVGPMVESVSAMNKFIAATQLAFPIDEQQDIAFAINVETISAVNVFDEMLKSPHLSDLTGIVMGRTDLTRSLNLNTDQINCDQVFEITKPLFIKAKAAGLVCGCGGGVSAHSLPFFRNLHPGTLDYFETRKVIFGWDDGHSDKQEQGILKAVGFELLWLKNKQAYYAAIAKEDQERINIMESRYKHSILEVGGKTD